MLTILHQTVTLILNDLFTCICFTNTLHFTCIMPLNLLHLVARMSTRDAIRSWVSHIDRRLSDRTCSQYKQVLWQFAEIAPAYLKDSTPEHIEKYLMSLTNCTNNSVNQYLVAIRSFYAWAAEMYDMPNVSKKVADLRKSPSQQRILTTDEYQKILSVCTQQQAAIVRFLACTGLRAAEFQSLRWENVSRDLKMLHIIGKGNQPRSVPLNDTCRRILGKYTIRRPNAFLPISKNYRYRNALWQMLKILSAKAGIALAGPHSLRHYFATRMIQKGVSIYYLSKILGHQSVQTTEKIYLHYTADETIGLTNCLD